RGRQGEVLPPDRVGLGVGASGRHPISSSPNGSSCHGRSPAPPITSMGPGSVATARTFVVTYWLPNHHSSTSSPVRVSANSWGDPNHSAWLGHTDAHIGFSPTDVRS